MSLAVLGAVVAGAASCTVVLGDDFSVAGDELACTAGQIACADGATLLLCPDGTPVTEACPGVAPVCESGACVACTAGTTQCSGRDVQSCVNGAWTTTETCAIDCEAAACLRVTDIGAGVAHTCAVLSNGTVRCWGYDKLALLFLDGLTDPPEPDSFTTTPTPVPDLANAVAVDGGDAHSCALTSANTVVCWGWNGIGQLGTGNFADATSPVTVPLGTGATAMTVAVGHTCAVLDNGNVACWGLNETGQIGNGQSGSGSFVSSPFELWLGFPAAKVSAQNGHTCATISTAEMACWGSNDNGQLGVAGTTLSTTPLGVLGEGVTVMGTGEDHTCGEDLNGFYCWGRNTYGQVGVGVAGADVQTPAPVSAVSGIRHIEGGAHHTCAVGSNGELWCWGDDSLGAVGIGNGGNVTSPELLAALPPVTDVATGTNHTCALAESGEVYCWGFNNRGQLGTGDVATYVVPSLVQWH
ncbi:MAG: hypothetical protein IT373_34895 [Polyangiaceae bacterium]|nr:hypothetical protein [Polyangiaceae bacterium]